ncbi:Crp/Fnr family transcriptional regulator [Clostridia bacterium]|nr:Crp/Fnr family transcriptional regulator [Clostridia bacterium]
MLSHIEIAGIVSKNLLFNQMTKEDIIFLLDCFNPRVTSLQKGEIYAHDGDAINAVHLVLSGSLLLFKETAEGERSVRDLLTPPDLFGEVAAFGRQKKWPVYVQAKEDAVVVALPLTNIIGRCERNCHHHNQLILNLMSILAEKAMGLHKQLGILSLGSLREKIARLLVQRQREMGKERFKLKMNILDTADYLGVARPSFSRELAKMKRDGLIQSEGRVFWIADFDRLVELAGE